MRPDISVVIPARNSERYLQDCLESLRVQTLETKRFEIIVVDNDSRDGTADIAEQFGARVVTSDAKNAAGVRNKGASVSSGEVLAFLDSDCVSPVRWLSSVLEEFGSKERRIVVGGTCLSPSFGASFVERYWAPNTTVFEGEVNCLPGANLSVNHEVFEELGGFDERLDAAEDDDFCFRAKEKGCRIISIRKLAVVHLGYPKSFSELFVKSMAHGVFQVRAHGFLGDKVVIITWLWILIFMFLVVCLFIASKTLIILAILLLMLPPGAFSYARIRRANVRRHVMRIPGIFIVSFIALLGRVFGLIKGLVRIK